MKLAEEFFDNTYSTDNTMSGFPLSLYRGIVENNNSPKKDGRIQVRIFGIHSEDKSLVKSEHLPWAEVIQSNVFGFSSGIGFTSIPLIGTWVYVILDHDNPNMPIILGSISGKSVKKSDFKYPLDDRLNEEDQNRLQRVQNLDKTIHKKINDTLDNVSDNDSFSGADVTMNEPPSLSNKSIYPHNNVIETDSGHILEIDDTPGNENIRLYHKSGTYINYRPDGSISEKIMKNINKIVQGYVSTHIKDNVKEYMEKNLDTIIDGGIRKNVKMDDFQHIMGLMKIKADGNLHIMNDVKIDGSLEASSKITAADNITSKAEIADSLGNLSSLRTQHDTNVSIFNAHTHTGNLGVPTSSSLSPESNDPKIRASDYSWSGTPKGFK